MPAAAREYDPEIKDIADYVANKPIDSDLAVSASQSPLPVNVGVCWGKRARFLPRQQHLGG